MNRRRFRPGMADARSREAAAIKLTEKRADLVIRRIASHGADGLNEWLESVGATAWGVLDGGEALAIIRRELGDEAWRKARDVVVMF